MVGRSIRPPATNYLLKTKDMGNYEHLKELLKDKVSLISKEDLSEVNAPKFYKYNFRSLLDAWADHFTPLEMGEMERIVKYETAKDFFVDAINWDGRRWVQSLFDDDQE